MIRRAGPSQSLMTCRCCISLFVVRSVWVVRTGLLWLQPPQVNNFENQTRRLSLRSKSTHIDAPPPNVWQPPNLLPCLLCFVHAGCVLTLHAGWSGHCASCRGCTFAAFGQWPTHRHGSSRDGLAPPHPTASFCCASVRPCPPFCPQPVFTNPVFTNPSTHPV